MPTRTISSAQGETKEVNGGARITDSLEALTSVAGKSTDGYGKGLVSFNVQLGGIGLSQGELPGESF